MTVPMGISVALAKIHPVQDAAGFRGYFRNSFIGLHLIEQIASCHRFTFSFQPAHQYATLHVVGQAG